MSYGLILGICGLTLNIFTIIGGAIGFCILKFNDFSHTEKKLDLVISKLDLLNEKTSNNEKGIAVINERCNTHKIIKKRKK